MSFHWLLRGWLQNAARQKVYEAAEQAARDAMDRGRDAPTDESPQHADAQDGKPPALPSPPPIGLLFSSAEEMGGFEDRIHGIIRTAAHGLVVRHGTLNDCPVVAMRPERKEDYPRAAEALIAGHRPRCLIAAGFATALDQDLRHGDVIVPDTIIDAQGNGWPVKQQSAAHVSGPRMRTGVLLSQGPGQESGHDGRKPSAKDECSSSAARVCREHSIPFLCVRVIIQEAGETESAEVRHLQQQDTTAARAGAFVGALFRRPSIIKDIWNKKERALVCTDRLAEVLDGLVKELMKDQG